MDCILGNNVAILGSKARFSKVREKEREREGGERESKRKGERETYGPIQRANLQRPSPAIRRTVAVQQRGSMCARARAHEAGDLCFTGTCCAA